jgi:small conductance mechanosensitive channel
VIEAANYAGEVKEIQIFNTILVTPEHKTVVIPNGLLSNGVIVNNSARGDVRSEIQLRVHSSHKIEEVRKIVFDIINADQRILSSPEPQVLVAGFGNDTLNLVVRFFTLTNEKAVIESETWEKIKAAFEKQGIQEARNYTIMKSV